MPKKNRKQWISLSPVLIEALEELAANEDLPLSAFISVLINEALAHRLRSRAI